MKKQFTLLTALLILSTAAWAQKEFKLAKSSGRLNLNIPGAIIEGYNGNEIIFSTQRSEDEVVDERAKGLKSLSGSGFVDNTGLGLDVSQNGQDINVNVVGKKLNGILNIKVPQNVKISYSNTSSIYHDEVILKNLKSEMEVSATYNKIKLENNTGPMNIKTVYGSVDASFASDIKGPVSIISVYNYVDITLPAATKANIEMGSSYGKLYAADQFKIAIDKNNGSDDKSTSVDGAVKSTSMRVNGINVIEGTRSIPINKNSENTSIIGTSGNGEVFLRGYSNFSPGERIKGTINGGGINLIFKSNYKNVYLRQQ
jgi:hypothetical protein